MLRTLILAALTAALLGCGGQPRQPRQPYAVKVLSVQPQRWGVLAICERVDGTRVTFKVERDPYPLEGETWIVDPEKPDQAWPNPFARRVDPEPKK